MVLWERKRNKVKFKIFKEDVLPVILNGGMKTEDGRENV